MKNETPPKKKNALVPLLICFMLILVFFSYKKHSAYNKLENVFIQEKKALQSELDELIEDYKSLSIRKKNLSKRLIKEINKIIALRDSVKQLKASQFRTIITYRRKIETLERQNKKLFFKVDSLSIANKTLKEEKTLVVEAFNNQKSESKDLARINKKLQKEVAKASIIEISPVSAIAMKERSSGKLTSTSRSSRTDAFKVNFKLLKNKVATSGNKKVHIQIINQDKNVISPKGTTSLKNGDKVVYSQELTAKYDRNGVNVLSLLMVNRDDINKGIYTFNAFVDGRFCGTTSVKLR